jgi:hypothetical protein
MQRQFSTRAPCARFASTFGLARFTAPARAMRGTTPIQLKVYLFIGHPMLDIDWNDNINRRTFTTGH